MIRGVLYGFLFCLICCVSAIASFAETANIPDHLTYEEYPTIRLRSLDKITARTLTFDAQVGTVIKFGEIYIKILSCRKPPAIEKTEAAAFLQIWEVDKVKSQSRWIFSGWMFASSPALSGMDHPVYDVWVIDCLGKDPEDYVPPIDNNNEQIFPDEGAVDETQAPKPSAEPQDEKIYDGNDESEIILPRDNPAVSDEPTSEPAKDSSPPQSESNNFDGIY